MSAFELCVLPDAESLASEACERIVTLASRARAAGQGLRVALAGGSTPRRLYEKLALEQRVEWSALELFFGDERVVPPTDPASNYRMVREAWLDHVAVPAERVHRIETERGARAAAAHYREVLGDAPLDLVLLGMGTDGHTASLFPDTPRLDEATGVLVTRSPEPPHERISLGLDVINRAATVILLVAGANKAARLEEVYTQRSRQQPTLPAAKVRGGRLVWLVDEDAAAGLRDRSANEPTQRVEG